jgi:hypothetical protein
MTTETPFTWSGSINLQGPSGWLSGSPSRRYTVCRYHDYDNSGTDSNFEHPATYSGVGESITDQNFLVIQKSDGNDCPDDDLNVGSTTTNIVIYFNTKEIQPTAVP